LQKGRNEELLEKDREVNQVISLAEPADPAQLDRNPTSYAVLAKHQRGEQVSTGKESICDI
jgi:hypothetical protein